MSGSPRAHPLALKGLDRLKTLDSSELRDVEVHEAFRGATNLAGGGSWSFEGTSFAAGFQPRDLADVREAIGHVLLGHHFAIHRMLHRILYYSTI